MAKGDRDEEGSHVHNPAALGLDAVLPHCLKERLCAFFDWCLEFAGAC